MSTMSDPTQPVFRLSMLVNDTRYRGITFQIIAFFAIVFLFGWMAWNATQNLAALGQNISYGFLGEGAGYDINQKLIPYASTDTHLRAAFVGILNTLLVAFLGCITATIIGVTVGVLRLSNNWLVAKLMSGYVEIFRNVPVLIWILIIFSVMSNALPAPSAFRGENATASMVMDAFAFTNRGVYIPRPVWEPGSWMVVTVFFLSIVGIFALRRYAVKLLFDTGREIPVLKLSLAIFFVPTLLVYFLTGMPISLAYPSLQGFNFQGGIQIFGSLIGLWFALALYTGAFIAENVRGGIMSVSKGQTEAAAALGMRPGRIMRLVILPQALRVIIPPLISQYLNLTKNSSLAAAVGYMDITGTLGGITLNQTGRSFEAILLLMLFYLIISLSIAGVMNIYNNAIKLKER
ncbi:amino acid ABC transporter permease [Meridianimarinicoccus aquatilis]|uniref:ABC transporter permease subunit n=1 Tax=Meridianimarinicoccus aquatilis TaxID=2552766 RepID=A0A4R6ASJ2_9RHOB|nr:ABC transporter permease subunit [Fluviibacterium aquatile]QIE41352.1 ABC transporter permease subunit [Rhodobacteraceae bacterium SC52]TDL87120.1 ABC transporter permease subunit [Fluviibacterium aquatile]